MTDRHWTFLSNHAHVLVCVAENPDVLVREIANRVGITERATQRILSELEQAGYVSHDKVGRRNRYAVHSTLPLRHPLEDHLDIGTLLQVIIGRS